MHAIHTGLELVEACNVAELSDVHDIGVTISFFGTLLMALDLLGASRLATVEQVLKESLHLIAQPRPIVSRLKGPSLAMVRYVWGGAFALGVVVFACYLLIDYLGFAPSSIDTWLQETIFHHPWLLDFLAVVGWGPVWVRVATCMLLVGIGRWFDRSLKSSLLRGSLLTLFLAAGVVVFPHGPLLLISAIVAVTALVFWGALCLLVFATLSLLAVPFRAGLELQRRVGFRHAITASGLVLVAVGYEIFPQFR